MKQFKDWNEGSLHHFLEIGDLVDEEFADYFIDVLPPATMTSRLIQLGEPYNHINGRAVFSTLLKTPEGWMYKGHCYAGETSEP